MSFVSPPRLRRFSQNHRQNRVPRRAPWLPQGNISGRPRKRREHVAVGPGARVCVCVGGLSTGGSSDVDSRVSSTVTPESGAGDQPLVGAERALSRQARSRGGLGPHSPAFSVWKAESRPLSLGHVFKTQTPTVTSLSAGLSHAPPWPEGQPPEGAEPSSPAASFVSPVLSRAPRMAHGCLGSRGPGD